MAARRSQLQKQVLSLYKQFLGLSKDKPGLANHVRAEFKKNAQLPKSDVLRIEFLIRRGTRQLQTLRTTSVQQVGSFEKGT
uniref:Complex 1 LYR protein domain-containing protein n=1 Tax=Branchiostoma floridae TaxID=7739 RepID=C3YPG0_BRAFL|eukprot:XP_002601732.1 hypothetical protein BRAFLDRAFT_215274 [Branchiostoma floridae]